MRINGAWVGWGLNDDSTSDFTVRNAKKYMRAMFRSYAGDLADTNLFDQQMQEAVLTMQSKLVARPMNRFVLNIGGFLPGVLDLPTQLAMGFRKEDPRPKPIIFTGEGHMSNMFFGPAASNAQTLEAQGVCHAKPVGDWDSAALPFNNQSGVNALSRQLGSWAIEGPPVDPHNPDGPKVMWPFPPGTSWGIIGFSQMGMIVSDFMAKEVMPLNAPLHWRLADFKRGLAIGNPRREYGKMCPWNDNPPPSNTQGIMGDVMGKGTFITTGTEIEGRWQENANDKDMFGVNFRNSAGAMKTAIAKIVTENGWGGPAGIFARVLAFFGNPVGEGYAAVKAAFDSVMFLVSRPNPHYATVAEPGDIEWMRGVAA